MCRLRGNVADASTAWRSLQGNRLLTEEEETKFLERQAVDWEKQAYGISNDLGRIARELDHDGLKELADRFDAFMVKLGVYGSRGQDLDDEIPF